MCLCIRERGVFVYKRERCVCIQERGVVMYKREVCLCTRERGVYLFYYTIYTYMECVLMVS